MSLYTTRTLARALEALDRPSSFLLDKFFPFVQTFETEKIDFDLINEQKKLAPFVSPMVKGKPQKDRGYITRSFEPAYVKPKNVIDPTRPFKRRPGEVIGGEMAPAQRHQAAVVSLMEDHRRQIIRRKEWMAAQALRFGKVTVSGEDYATDEVDFLRDLALTLVLVDGNRWGEAGVKMLKTLEDGVALIQAKSGAISTEVVLDPLAWQLLREDETFMKLLDNRRQTSGNVELGPIAVGGEEQKARFVGSVGDFNFWVYSDTYVDENGVEQKFLADYQVIIGGSQIEGVQAHGAIRDNKFGFQALEFAPKIIEEDDPAVEFLLTQSAPLVVPARANASMSIVVR